VIRETVSSVKRAIGPDTDRAPTSCCAAPKIGTRDGTRLAVALAERGNHVNPPVRGTRFGVVTQHASRRAAVEREQVARPYVIAYGFWGILTEQTQALLALARVKRGALASKLHEALQQPARRDPRA
jgi:hypothetical protein